MMPSWPAEWQRMRQGQTQHSHRRLLSIHTSMATLLRLLLVLSSCVALARSSVLWSEDTGAPGRSLDEREYYSYENEDSETNHTGRRDCFSVELAKTVPSGSAWPTDYCEEARCNNGSVFGFSCEPVPELPLHSKCRVEYGDTNLAYPHCCPRIRCPGFHTKP